jgi:tetratricopeptide (TPR) repeat protein
MDKPQINNEGPVQGQNIGQQQWITQHFHGIEGSTTPERVWMVPYRRNGFFTGRETLLTVLHTRFMTNRTAVLTQGQAINGLGGIGKTQIAVEYAYRHRDAYRFVLWTNAATHDTLISAFVTVADGLQLPERTLQEQDKIVAAVLRWLSTNEGWLLIVDNADELEMVWPLLPTGSTGHVLVTTRDHGVGDLESFPVEQMDRREGILLLLRRARILKQGTELEHISLADRQVAEQIVAEMDGLPLALDQAGAYIDENRCDLPTYLERYRTQRATLLGRRGRSSHDHHDPVATTWSLSFQQVEQKSSVAADLLCFCAFLHPDAIPEAIITKGASYLGEHLQGVLEDQGLLDEAIGALRAYSLIRRNTTEKMLNVHRLVQAVLRDNLKPTQQRTWAERVIRAMNKAIPEPSILLWQEWQLYLPHIHTCSQLIEEYDVTSRASGQLLNQAGTMLRHSSRHAEAEKMYERALLIHERVLGPEHPDTAATLDHLATISGIQRKYEQALHLYERALCIREHVLGPEHPDTAITINGLALLYSNWHRYEESQHMYERSLHIREHVLGPEHPDTAETLDNLAMLYRIWSKYEQAEPLFERALRIRECSLGPEHPITSSTLNNLAVLYRLQGKYEQAIPLFERALHIREQTLGLEHPATATAMSNLAYLYRLQGEYEQSLHMYERALHIREQAFGASHPNATITRFNMGQLYRELSAYGRAEELIRCALTTHEQALGSEHPKVADILEEYARLQHDVGQDEEAGRTEARAQAIRSRVAKIR